MVSSMPGPSRCLGSSARGECMRSPCECVVYESALAAVLCIGRGLDAATGDALAHAFGHIDPGFRIVIHVDLTGARVLAGAAVVLAGLDDACALLVVALGGQRVTGAG